MRGSIRLRAADFNQWLDEMERELTVAGDGLNIMEAEGERIRQVWESEAGAIWKAEFQIGLNEVRDSVAEMKKVVLQLGRGGRILADLESRMISQAEKL